MQSQCICFSVVSEKNNLEYQKAVVTSLLILQVALESIETALGSYPPLPQPRRELILFCIPGNLSASRVNKRVKPELGFKLTVFKTKMVL
jgi:hypothetical protein